MSKIINGVEYLTVTEASKYLGKASNYLSFRRRLELDSPKCYQIDKRRFYLTKDLDEWKKNRMKEGK